MEQNIFLLTPPKSMSFLFVSLGRFLLKAFDRFLLSIDPSLVGIPIPMTFFDSGTIWLIKKLSFSANFSVPPVEARML